MRAIALVLLAAGCTPISDLVVTSEEPVGANCAHGGTAIREGADDNDDGELQADEVDSVHYACDAAPATSELVSVSPEPPGPNCPLGGHAVTTGTDANRDGILDTAEVRTKAYVCSGQLVVTRPEPQGDNCLTGGTAILVGDDVNADGLLSEDEVTATSYVCDGIFDERTITGTVNVRNNLDIALLANIEEIMGTLRVNNQAGAFESLRLPALQRVGMLIVYDNVDLSFPVLRAVDTMILEVGASTTSRTLEIPQLETVSGYLRFEGNWIAFDAPALESVGEYVSFRASSHLQRIDAPALESVSGNVTLYGLPALAHVDLASLETLNGLSISRCPNLAQENFNLPPVQTLPSGIWLERVPWTTLGPLSTTASGDFAVIETAIADITLPNLTTVGRLRIEGDAVTNFSAPMLQSVTTGPVYIDAPLLPACQITDVLDAIGYQGARTVHAAACSPP